MICNNCNGDGIVGNGDNPAAKEGDTKTCGVCTGTGQVADVEEVTPAPVEEVVPPTAEVVAEPVSDETPTE